MDNLFDIQNLRYDADGRTIIEVGQLQIKNGAHSLILGRSGSGKSTLMHLMAGLLRPSAGRILFQGRDVSSLSEAQKDALRGQKMGFVFQGLHLLRHLNVHQNIILGLKPAIAREADIEGILQTLGLAGFSGRKVSSLSYGEAQRVAIARGIIHRPAVIFADEPTSALDDENADAVMDLLLAQAQKAGAALIVSTHDSRIRDRLDNVIRIDAGRVGIV